MKKIKLAIILSHPVQHFCPVYASWTKRLEIKLKVFFATSHGAISYFDKDFGETIKWDNLYLNEFDHEFLSNDNLSDIVNKNLLKKLEIKLSEFSPDVVLTYGYSQKIQRRTLRWAGKNNCKILFVSDSELRHKRKWYRRIVKQIFLPWYFKKIDAFLTVGDANENYYTSYGVKLEKMYKVPFPIDYKLADNAYKRMELHKAEIAKKYNIQDDYIICSTVGKLVETKRQEDIINAIKFLGNKNQKIILFVIGSGAKQKDLIKIANTNDNVIFTGFLKPSEITAYLAVTDIYIHSSSVDAHPLAVSEAIYMGCAVLISDKCGCYGPTDDVQPGRNGFVFNCGNYLEIAKYISMLYEQNNLLQAFKNESREIGQISQKLSHELGLQSVIRSIFYLR